MKILFCGQAPSRESDGHPPFTGKCGAFLAQLMGLSQEQMLLQHDFMNVLDRWPGKGLGGDKFPMGLAKEAARTKVEQMRGRCVVLLGHNVARAFGAEKFSYFEWYSYRNPKDVSDIVIPKLTVVPHPSQVSRHWNNVDNRNIASKFLTMLAAIEEKS